MARIKLLKRIFKETGKVLGDFPATVLEDFEKTFTDSDEAQEGPRGDGPTEVQRVPDPPRNPIKDKDPDKPQKGPEKDDYQKSGKNPPGEEGDNPGDPTFNRKGDDLDNENPVDPNRPENNGGEEEEAVGPKSDEENPNEPGNEGDPGNDGPGGEPGNEGEDGNEPGDGTDEGENGNKPGNDDDGNKPGGEPWDEPGDGPGGEPGDEPGGEPGDEPGDGPVNGGDYRDPKDGPESTKNPYDNNKEGGPQNWDDAQPNQEHVSGKSIMEEALKRMKEGKSAVEKDKDDTEQEIHGDGETANKNRDSSNNKNSGEEYRKAKDAVGDAAKRAQADKATKPESMFDNEDVFDEDSLLGDMGTSSLTSLWKPSVKRDWKVLLDRLLDKALGFSIQLNPNLINKRIEDAPPGRESETKEIKKILVIIDCSGSMGSDAFIKVINQIDAMMSAKRDLSKAMFQIVGFGDNDMEYVLAREEKCKGKNFKTTIMGGFKAGGSTNILPAIQRCVTKYRNFDAVLIFTDGDIYDANKCSKSPECSKFFKKYRDRVIWVLTEKRSLQSAVAKIDPYSVQRKQYIVFKGK